ncbi:hypothetical protein [Planctomicrobium piriforme]|uniref:Carboxypeptidase regulatory-like domain-containing protein n=1 Tax=Planctomicrobium piriforme TaxID=1576369 RepID=A0A1I3B4V2_9PLAN|nr:hypothetical protein [Planctomicrobium piriforme]SFH57220.1 hypothetical protein SAMN05421753_101232 [Planctomicrobium piriforme]
MRQSIRFLIVPVAMGSLLLLNGCGKKVSGRPEPVPVKGLVLVNGQPLGNTTLVFAPEGHQYAAFGQSDEQGRFQLTTFDKGDGAVPGKFSVTASNFWVEEHPGGSVTEHHKLPAKFRDPATSGLSATVTEDGPNEITVEVQASGSGETIHTPG